MVVGSSLSLELRYRSPRPRKSIVIRSRERSAYGLLEVSLMETLWPCVLELSHGKHRRGVERGVAARLG